MWTRVKLASGEVGECWHLLLGWDDIDHCQWDDLTRRRDGSLAVRSSGDGSDRRRRRVIPVPVEMESFGIRR